MFKGLLSLGMLDEAQTEVEKARHDEPNGTHDSAMPEQSLEDPPTKVKI